jgi:integrase
MLMGSPEVTPGVITDPQGTPRAYVLIVTSTLGAAKALHCLISRCNSNKKGGRPVSRGPYVFQGVTAMAEQNTTAAAHRSPERRTLKAAAEDAVNGHWSGMRSLARAKSQVMIGVRFLESLGRQYLDEVTEADIRSFRDWSLRNGLAPGSVNCRMAALSVIGVKVRYCKLPRKRKWWLAPAEEAQLLSLGLPPILSAFVKWTLATGLRVEESLALRWNDADLEVGTVHVTGTKTDMAEATLPLSQEALGVLVEWRQQSRNLPPYSSGGGGVIPLGRVFPCSYRSLWVLWQQARSQMGLMGVPTATLKSLRRSFARRAHVNGMPVDILRQYLRHSSLKTTEGYLWLIGGYSQDEMRRYLG